MIWTKPKLVVDLMRGGLCPFPFNEPYIDVVSMDIYFVNFQPALSERYQFLYEHRPTPYQQLALVPGVFTGGHDSNHNQNGAQAAARLLGFFEYAASMNQHCDLPLGPTGITGSYDGCPLWMIVGFTGGVAPVSDAPGYLPIDNPASILVFDAWQAAFAVRRVDPTQVRRALELIPLLFQD